MVVGLEPGPKLRYDIADASAGVLGDGQLVQFCQLLVHTQEAEVTVHEAQPDRPLGMKLLDEAQGLVEDLLRRGKVGICAFSRLDVDRSTDPSGDLTVVTANARSLAKCHRYSPSKRLTRTEDRSGVRVCAATSRARRMRSESCWCTDSIHFHARRPSSGRPV